MSTTHVSSKAVLPLIVIALTLLVSGVYWQTGGHAFINIDDDIYVSENPVVLMGLTLEGTSWAFTTLYANFWHPLTWLSHMLDVELFGPSAGWHHRMSALYHLLNTILLFLVLRRMTDGVWQSAFVAALFGVHPLHVESVAWVAERKDVLSTLFWILTMGAYLRYARRPGLGRYLPVAALFALGLMSKPMLVTLPFVLLLLDWWPLGRFTPHDTSVHTSPGSCAPVFFRLVWEKVPLLAMSVISCAIAYLAQARGGAVLEFEHIPAASRISNAIVSYAAYLWKTAWPSSLAVFYPHPAIIHASVPAWKIAGAILLLCGLSVIALREARRRPYLAVGWLWYLGTLVPLIGLVQVGEHAMADRYTYVPLIGIFIAVAWGVPSVLSRWNFRRVALGVLGGAAVLAFSAAAWSQVGYWKNSVTLLSRTVSVTDRNWLAMNNLGISYIDLGQYQQAIKYFQDSSRSKPDFVAAWCNLGVAYQKLDRHQEAIGYFQEALRIKPDDAESQNNLGVSYQKLGRHQEAIAIFRELLRIQPYRAETWNNLGISYLGLGQYRQAVGCFQNALRINPDYEEARNNGIIAIGMIEKGAAD